ncbi:MAG: hypothetical protein AAGJ35_07350, partial [Myxococcota bacterium]
LLRHKMEYHARKLATFLPLCFLQQLQDVHIQLTEEIDAVSFSLRQAYMERLEKREIGFEVDRIRHRTRKIKTCLESLQRIRQTNERTRQILQHHRPRH